MPMPIHIRMSIHMRVHRVHTRTRTHINIHRKFHYFTDAIHQVSNIILAPVLEFIMHHAWCMCLWLRGEKAQITTLDPCYMLLHFEGLRGKASYFLVKYEAVCYQLTYFTFGGCENICTESYSNKWVIIHCLGLGHMTTVCIYGYINLVINIM